MNIWISSLATDATRKEGVIHPPSRIGSLPRLSRDFSLSPSANLKLADKIQIRQGSERNKGDVEGATGLKLDCDVKLTTDETRYLARGVFSKSVHQQNARQLIFPSVKHG